MALLLSTLAPNFIGRSNTTPYTFRDSANKPTIPRPRTNYLRNSFRYSGAVLWNSLPQTLRQAESLSNFRSLLNNHYNIKLGTAFMENRFSYVNN